MASETAFFSALQPNTSVTTYGLPSDSQFENGGSVSNEVARARRVQQQVQMRMAEKSTLPRQNGSATHYAMSDYGSSSTKKYQTYNPSFSSKSSYVYSGSRTMAPRVSQRSGFSCQSAGPDIAQFQRMSVGGGGAGGGVVVGGGGGNFYREEIRMGGYQGNARQQNQMDPETISVHSLRQQPMYSFMVDNSDADSMVSDRDAIVSRHYAQSAVNGYASQIRPGAGTMTFPPPMRKSLSGNLTGGEAEFIQQHSFKGPAHRTISRITNRNRMSMGSMPGTLQHQMSSGGSTYGGGGDRVDRGFIASGVSSGSQGNLYMQRQGNLSRAMSIKSMHSVGKGMDIYGQEMGISMADINAINSLDMPTAVQYLRELDPELKVLGAAFIQHECYSDNESKDEVRRLDGIIELVRLFNNENQEVQSYATGATRNLIYENMDNKKALIDKGGIPALLQALKVDNDELRKNITGILWNLSSKDNLKESLAKDVLPHLTEKVLAPISMISGAAGTLTPSETDIFCNTTGCLRNLSSVSDKTRRRMRETEGLVDCLVNYVKATVQAEKGDDKGTENAVCILRNLSYQLYNEISPAALERLEGSRNRSQQSEKGGPIGCFTPQSRKAKNIQDKYLPTFHEISRVPTGCEILWHPLIIEMYKNVLQECKVNSTTREAAAGALQNITSGDKRWAAVLSNVALEKEHILPVLLELLDTDNDLELRSITGVLRNLTRHTKNKDDMATKVVNSVLDKLPEDPRQKEPSCEVVVNICAILNNLVTYSQVAARDIVSFNGLPKLFAFKEERNKGAEKLRAARAAAIVLSNMFQYKKLHKTYREKGYSKEDFANLSF